MASDSPDMPRRAQNADNALKRFLSKVTRRKPSSSAALGLPADYATRSSLETSEQEMIRGIIGLSDKIAREVMIPRVDIVAVSADIPLRDLIKVIDDAGHSRIPVYNDTIDNITGILHVKDLMPLITRKPRRFDLRKYLNKPYFVPETISLDDLLIEFKRRQLHIACVVDEYGGFGGIVTLEDILEEIVGEIKDEFDEDETPEIRKIGRSAYDLDSRMSISDFNVHTGLSLPEEEFDTVGGLVFDLFGKIPKKNEMVKYENISFRVKEIKGTRIMRIIASVSQK
jgi:magnesium and cobalt transporter